VVKRALEEHEVHRRAAPRKGAGIPDDCGNSAPPGLFDVANNRVDEEDLVAPLGKPACVGARAAADVEDPGASRGEEAGDDLPAPRKLEGSDSFAQARGFVRALVVLLEVSAHPSAVGRGVPGPPFRTTFKARASIEPTSARFAGRTSVFPAFAS